MNVLMVEELSPSATETADSLRSAGIQVRTCRDSLENFACRAMRGGECPLDTVPIDAAVAVHASDGTIATFGANREQAPSLGDQGIACSIRHHVPLVMVCDTGDPWGGPFDEWIDAACIHDEVADEVEGVVEGRSETYSAIASRALGDTLRLYGVENSAASASVIRKNGRLAVTIDLPSELRGDVKDGCAIKVHDVLHSFDPWIATIDVTVV